MPTKIWLRNPHNYYVQIYETGHPYTVWNWSTLNKRRTDPVAFSQSAFGGLDWETLVVGGQGCAHYRSGDSFQKPSAVYPFFNAADDDLDLLNYLIKNPVRAVDFSDELGGTIRPVPGQEHRIVVGYLPAVHTMDGKSYYRMLGDLQRDNPDCKIHIFGCNSFYEGCRVEVDSLDYDARVRSFHGEIDLPAGPSSKRPMEIVEEDRLQQVRMFDVPISVLDKDPVERCIFNIRSALWAGDYYATDVQITPRKRKRRTAKKILKVPLEAPEEEAKLPGNQPKAARPFIRHKKISLGDRLSCNHCTLQFTCRVYREGSVCVLPNSDGKRLADMFNTRDAEGVIDGLKHLLTMQANRLQDAMQDEEQADDGLNPEVSKEIKATFENGKTLAQLMNPALKGGPKVVGTMNTGANQTLVVNSGSANAMIGTVIRAFEAKGIARDQITSEMMTDALQALSAGKAIEA